MIAIAVPAIAQGPFADVPVDHWAYQAVNELADQGVILGYPNGTFQGKRALTRYEFAVALARAIPVIAEMVKPGGIAAAGVSQADFDKLQQQVNALQQKVGTPTTGGQPTGAVTQEQFNTLQRLVNEFRDELASLGVDVDALKRDIAALTQRVAILEAEDARVNITGTGNVFGIATKIDTGAPVDADNRLIGAGDMLNNVGVVFDGNLNIKGRLSDMASVMSTINYGNYLNYIQFVDDYAGGARQLSKATGLTENVFPYYLYVDTPFWAGDLEVGRLPLQFTPYTLKKIDVDSYTDMMATDSGDYPVDGAKMVWRSKGWSVTGFAAKNNQNTYLSNGLTSQANGGLYTLTTGQFNAVGCAAAGGLTSIDQSAGARLLIGTPMRGNLGLTYIRVAGTPTVDKLGTTTYDQADIFGGDLNFNYRKFNVAFEYAQTITKQSAGTGGDIDSLNQAFDGSIGFNLGALGLDLGYKSVEPNFTAPGSWDKIGRWANPTNIQGPYLSANYGLTSNVKLAATGAFYNGANAVSGLPAVFDDEDDDLWQAKASLKWGITPAWGLNADAEFVRWEPSGAGADSSDEAYYTIGAMWQLNPSAGLKLAYQIVDYSPAASGAAPYGNSDYKGNLAVAEFGVKF